MYINVVFLFNFTGINLILAKLNWAKELHTGDNRSTASLPTARRTTPDSPESPEGRDLMSQFLIRLFVDSHVIDDHFALVENILHFQIN